MDIEFLTQHLFENAHFTNHTLMAVDTKQVSGEPVHTIYVPIDVKDDESGESFSSAVTITRNNPTKSWEVKCSQIQNTKELAEAWEYGIEKPEITKNCLPLGMQIKCSGDVFVVSSHSNGVNGELRAGLVNSQDKVMSVSVESMLHELETGRSVALGHLDQNDLTDKDFFAWRKSFFDSLK